MKCEDCIHYNYCNNKKEKGCENFLTKEMMEYIRLLNQQRMQI